MKKANNKNNKKNNKYKKLIEFEDGMLNIIKKYTPEILFALAIIISLVVKSYLIDYKSDDYNDFLSAWMNTIKANGGMHALKNAIGNYNAPYLTIMAIISYLDVNYLTALKIVSIVFDYIMAVVVMLIIYELFKNDKRKHTYALIGFVVTSLLPTVILNSSAWAQCDSIYASFALLSILFLLKEKNIKAFIFLGIAFSFKLQAIFLFPIFILVYLSKRNFSITNFLIIPVMNFIMCLPAIIMGKPILDCFTVYIDQTRDYSKYIAMNFPNIYCIFMKPDGGSNLIINNVQGLDSFGTYFTLFCFLIIGLVFIHKKIKLDNKLIIKVAILTIMFTTFMLPHMHDRYLYIADILAVVYFVLEPKKFYISLGVWLVSLYTYIEYICRTHAIPMYIVAIFFAIIISILAKDTINDLNKNGLKTKET